MMMIHVAFDNFILSRRLADLSDKTISAYRQFVTPFISYLGLERPLEEVMQSDITSYIAELLNKPISKATRATYIRHVKIFLRWCQSEYEVSYNAKAIKVPKSPKRSVRIYSDSEIAQIFQSVETDTEWLTLRNQCIIALMYDSGLRQSEVCGLKRSRVSFSDNRMVVHGKGDKERIVPLGKLTQKLMRAYLSQCPYKSENVFVNRRGEPLTCNAVKLFISKLSDKLDFEFSSHKLRHNFATNYCIDQYTYNGQVDIYRLMYLMGHEEIETTRRYLHFANEVMASRGCISHLDMVLLGKN